MSWVLYRLLRAIHQDSSLRFGSLNNGLLALDRNSSVVWSGPWQNSGSWWQNIIALIISHLISLHRITSNLDPKCRRNVVPRSLFFPYARRSLTGVPRKMPTFASLHMTSGEEHEANMEDEWLTIPLQLGARSSSRDRKELIHLQSVPHGTTTTNPTSPLQNQTGTPPKQGQMGEKRNRGKEPNNGMPKILSYWRCAAIISVFPPWSVTRFSSDLVRGPPPALKVETRELCFLKDPSDMVLKVGVWRSMRLQPLYFRLLGFGKKPCVLMGFLPNTPPNAHIVYEYSVDKTLMQYQSPTAGKLAVVAIGKSILSSTTRTTFHSHSTHTEIHTGGGGGFGAPQEEKKVKSDSLPIPYNPPPCFFLNTTSESLKRVSSLFILWRPGSLKGPSHSQKGAYLHNIPSFPPPHLVVNPEGFTILVKKFRYPYCQALLTWLEPRTLVRLVQLLASLRSSTKHRTLPWSFDIRISIRADLLSPLSLCAAEQDGGDQVEQKSMFIWLARAMFNTNELVSGNCKKSSGNVNGLSVKYSVLPRSTNAHPLENFRSGIAPEQPIL
ncbi:uncharacterized protein CLUP02_06002 [Colletotrichum lupini]|uniref:Uncharacterized protein n=1 Tax=Colletotrichum lupini TaxID=145971 RepID=A0A9Q8SNA2_9PEZI|nr:uncharacterized protein CLUP02_06002 [Colletotrichum lupini]UQC80519.1 hypothetical protein CLUP02_06002 [Colletotrichum lupini]